jgi:hypothetical protein
MRRVRYLAVRPNVQVTRDSDLRTARFESSPAANPNDLSNVIAASKLTAADGSRTMAASCSRDAGAGWQEPQPLTPLRLDMGGGVVQTRTRRAIRRPYPAWSRQ